LFLVVTPVTVKKPSYGMCRSVSLVRADVSEECIASIIRVTRIGELGTKLAVTSNRSMRWAEHIGRMGKKRNVNVLSVESQI
jgi:hypothetical protein